jgi:hypothetical protein
MSRNLVLEKITREADKLARQWNKNKDPGIRDQWYAIVRKAAEHAPKEEMGYRINFKRKS